MCPNLYFFWRISNLSFLPSKKTIQNFFVIIYSKKSRIVLNYNVHLHFRFHYFDFFFVLLYFNNNIKIKIFIKILADHSFPLFSFLLNEYVNLNSFGISLSIVCDYHSLLCFFPFLSKKNLSCNLSSMCFSFGKSCYY